MTVRLGGACCVVGSAIFTMQLPNIRQIVRPIYTQMGILPAAAAGIQAATEETVPREH
jgi:hypothetical protein